MQGTWGNKQQEREWHIYGLEFNLVDRTEIWWE